MSASGRGGGEEMLDRIGLARIAREQRPFVAEDFVFEASAFAATNATEIVHEELLLEETPLAVVRQIHLQHRQQPHTSLRLTLALCWNGFAEALSMLERFPSSFQRAFSPTAVANTADRYQIGDVGIAWSWSGAAEPDVLAFVRNNVFASLVGHDASAMVRPAAAQLDERLRRLRTGGPYADEPRGLLADVRGRAGDVPRVRSGGRLELGAPPAGSTERIFFLTTSGSVNRSQERAGGWYYRAGAEQGRQEILLFRVGRGILPARERLTVDVGQG